MLHDIITPSSYLTFNVRVAHILGLNNAVYCAELLDIYNKAKRKNKLDENKFFTVNRDYVKARTSITLDEQYLCDASLSKVKLIESSEGNPDKIYFDVERYINIIAEDDAKTLNVIVKKVSSTRNVADSKTLKKEKNKLDLKKAIVTSDVKLRSALEAWIDALFDSYNMLKESVTSFEKTLTMYSKDNISIALEVVQIARLQGICDCVTAIEIYEKNQKFIKKEQAKIKTNTQAQVASYDNLSKRKF